MKITAVIADGRGPVEIIQLARKSSGNMVAMSTHGRSDMARWVWVALPIASYPIAATQF
jgi:nucleotide-binding universal stress UspA family protein